MFVLDKQFRSNQMELYFRVGSWPYPQILYCQACQGQTLRLIMNIRKLLIVILNVWLSFWMPDCHSECLIVILNARLSVILHAFIIHFSLSPKRDKDKDQQLALWLSFITHISMSEQFKEFNFSTYSRSFVNKNAFCPSLRWLKGGGGSRGKG